jgi:hypothetical protein
VAGEVIQVPQTANDVQIVEVLSNRRSSSPSFDLLATARPNAQARADVKALPNHESRGLHREAEGR